MRKGEKKLYNNNYGCNILLTPAMKVEKYAIKVVESAKTPRLGALIPT